MTAFLLVTDLDNTLVGDRRTLNAFNRHLSDRRDRDSTKLVYATGRSLTLYRQLATEENLLAPDALIAAVGTEIYFDSSRAEVDADWAAHLSPGWDRDRACAIAGEFSDLVLQPKTEQNPFKISYYLSKTVVNNLLPELEAALVCSGLAVQLIYSGDRDLDILPERGNKGLAVQYLRNKWGIPADRTIVCGDSGNDIALFAGEGRGIIVGNAMAELCQWHRENPSPDRYRARSPYAGGILEGLEYFGFLTPV